MTWVIGRAGPFGYAVGISDIRVTLGDGTEYDCLQKIYKIGSQLVLGFAGSVAIGLEIVNQLSEALHTTKEGMAWNPIIVAENLPKGTRELYDSFPSNQKALGCQLILLAAHPAKNDGPAPGARCYVYTFSAPEFRPILADQAQIVSIGSGAQVESYKKALGKLEKDFEIFKLETHMFGGAALGLMTSISSEIRKIPVYGISNHVHVCIVGRESIQIGQNDRKISENSEKDFIMPPVARSWDELNKLLSTASTSALEQARC